MNVKLFWEEMWRNENNKKQSEILIFERNVYLHQNMDDEEGNEFANVIIIGVSPYNRMKVCARIESRAVGGSMRLDGNSLLELLECVEDRFCENAVIPRNNRNVTIKQVNECIYKISIGTENIKLCLETLLALRRKQQIIKLHIKLLERENYAAQLYKLLHHFCFESKQEIVMQTLHTSVNISKEKLTNELLCMMHHKCVDMAFVLEIASNCLEWFAMCVPLFIKTLIHSQ